MSYSLKDLPKCYSRQVPPKISRWLAVLVAMLVISVILMRIPVSLNMQKAKLLNDNLQSLLIRQMDNWS